jgi:hypothetical protein
MQLAKGEHFKRESISEGVGNEHKHIILKAVKYNILIAN